MKRVLYWYTVAAGGGCCLLIGWLLGLLIDDHWALIMDQLR